MNADQKTRLEIMKALEKDFPDRLLEDLIEVARYVEGGGIERDRSESQDSAAKYLEETAKAPEARTWMRLEHIPSTVKRIKDKVGDLAEPRTLNGKREWFFTDTPFGELLALPDDGPFMEALS